MDEVEMERGFDVGEGWVGVQVVVRSLGLTFFRPSATDSTRHYYIQYARLVPDKNILRTWPCKFQARYLQYTQPRRYQTGGWPDCVGLCRTVKQERQKDKPKGTSDGIDRLMTKGAYFPCIVLCMSYALLRTLIHSSIHPSPKHTSTVTPMPPSGISIWGSTCIAYYSSPIWYSVSTIGCLESGKGNGSSIHPSKSMHQCVRGTCSSANIAHLSPIKLGQGLSCLYSELQGIPLPLRNNNTAGLRPSPCENTSVRWARKTKNQNHERANASHKSESLKYLTPCDLRGLQAVLYLPASLIRLELALLSSSLNWVGSHHQKCCSGDQSCHLHSEQRLRLAGCFQ